MKKILLGTTALFAAAALAAPANAADKIKLSLGGYATAGIAWVDNDEEDFLGAGDTDEHDIVFGYEAEVHFKGKTTLDNGLVVAFTAELEMTEDNRTNTSGNNDIIDEVFTEVSGGFGKIQFGEQDGVGDQMHVSMPWAMIEVASSDADQSPLGISNIATVNDGTTDYAKIIYMTPRIAGFQLGTSYTPQATRFQGVAYLDDDSTGDYEKVWEIAGNYKGEFNGLGLAFSADYLTAEDTRAASVEDIEAYSFGANVSFAGFTLGGEYYNADGVETDGTAFGFYDSDDAASGGEYESWSVGLLYAVGPWSFGGNYAEADGEEDPADDLEAMAWNVGVTYEVGPGVTWSLGYLYEEVEFNSADADGSAIITEFGLKF